MWQRAKAVLLNSLNDPSQEVLGMGAPLAMATTGRALAGARLARAMQRAPQPLTEAVKLSEGGLALRQPILSRLEDALEVGATRPADWQVGDRLLPAAGNAEELERYVRGVGATSPSTQFVKNIDESLGAHELYLRGQPLTNENLARQGIGIATNKGPNVRRAYAGQELLSEGYPMKTESFSQLLLGKDRYPLDSHTIQLLGSNPEQGISKILPDVRAYLQSVLGRRVSPGEAYLMMESAVGRGLRQVAGRAFRPVDTFAQMWEGIRGSKGLPYYRGMYDILDRMGLTAPGALRDPKLVSRARGTAFAVGKGR